MKKLFLLLVTVLTISLCASAQMRTVKGTVLDADNDEPLIGVSVTAGPGTGAATDVDGKFAIQVPASATTLQISYVGYKTQNVKIGTGDITVRLHSDSELLNEVIAVAYGQATRASFTGSAAVVDASAIENSQSSNALNALSGKVAGVQINNASGAPGSDSPSILIRGISSINAGTSPLIVVDGTPFSGSMNTINSNDIESMTVLKDAASAALYGARGANGVILSTTKRAKSGEATVTVDIKLGANSKAAKEYNYITNPAQYYETYYKSLYNYRLSLGDTPGAANAWANNNITSNGEYGLGYNVYTLPNGQGLIGLNGKLNPNATLGRMVLYQDAEYWLQPDNWMDATYKTSLRQEYNLSVAKGGDQTNFYLSASYLDNQGITIQSNFKRFTGRLAADTQAKSWLKVSGDISYTHYETDSYGSEEGNSGSTGNPFAFSSSIAPIYPLYMRGGDKQILKNDRGQTLYDYGTFAGSVRPIFSGANAISDALYNKGYTQGNAMSATGGVDVKLPYGFKVTANQNLDWIEYTSTSFINPFFGMNASENGILYKNQYRRLNYTFQQLINWSQKYGRHNVAVLLGHENFFIRTFGMSASRSNMFDPTNMELAGMVKLINNNSYTTPYNNEGWLMRAQYDFDNKYFASASFRRDASSRFHPKHRWGNFWSFGAAWNMTDEVWFQDVDWIDMLKVKASYGEQGNDNIGDWLYTNTYTVEASGDDVSLIPYRMGNENITWEKNANFNAGVEFAFFNNRLSGSFEGFIRKTSDMLFSFPLPPSMGWTSYYANVGDMMNKGIELDLQGTVINTKDFTWDINLNLTWYKNEISKLPEERRTSFLETVPGYSSDSYFYGEGLPMYTFRMAKSAGVDRETGKQLWYTYTPEVKQKFQEMSAADNSITSISQVFPFAPENVTTTDNFTDAEFFNCGTALPDVYGGFGTNLRYKWFDLSLAFNYQIGGQCYDSTYAGLMSSPQSGGQGGNIHADILDAWTPENPNSNIPRWQFGDKNFTQTSDRFLTDASYLSLQNIVFGFTLPDNITKKLFLKSCRVYFNADNVWLWSKRQGLDPRLSVAGGGNATYYSPIRTLSGGINITF